MKVPQSLRRALGATKTEPKARPASKTQGTQTTAPTAAAAWHGDLDTDGVPTRMLCPISRSIMLDPVVASDGITYERAMIAQVLKTKKRESPMTREKLSRRLFANGALQREVKDFLAANPQHSPNLTAPQQAALTHAVRSGVPAHQAMGHILGADVADDASAEAYLYAMPGLEHTGPSATRTRQASYHDEEVPRTPPPFAPPPVPRPQTARHSAQAARERTVVQPHMSREAAIFHALQTTFNSAVWVRQDTGNRPPQTQTPSPTRLALFENLGLGENMTIAQYAAHLGATPRPRSVASAASSMHSAVSDSSSEDSFDVDAFIDEGGYDQR